MKIKGKEVLWKSEKENIAVAFSQFDMGDKFKVYRKIYYSSKNSIWEYVIAFGTMGEAVMYAGKIYDEKVMR